MVLDAMEEEGSERLIQLRSRTTHCLACNLRGNPQERKQWLKMKMPRVVLIAITAISWSPEPGSLGDAPRTER